VPDDLDQEIDHAMSGANAELCGGTSATNAVLNGEHVSKT
jgi:hypothetical protein